MDWAQVWAVLAVTSALFLTSIGACISLFIWNRSESRADIRHMDSKLESTRELVRAIYDETKDFHNRLCRIEERNKEKK